MGLSHKKLLSIIVSCFLLTNLFAQTDISAEKTKKSFFKFDVNYLSNAIYFARKDSSPVPYLRSSITYNNKSGFYVGAGMALLISGDEPVRIDLAEINGGYSFSIGNFDAGVYASKFFYSKASFAVGSELKGLTGVYIGYNLGPVSINGGGDLLFSTKTDVNANIGLSHEFETGEENNHWKFAPTLQANAGTQFFNEAYYQFRKFSFPTTASNGGSSSSNGSGSGKGKGHSKGSNSGSGTTNTVVKTVTFYDKNRFTILDLELSLPIDYDANHWGLYIKPVVAFPTNAAGYAIDNAIQKEKLSTVFFTEVGAYIKF
jgi:hypothetical protein